MVDVWNTEGRLPQKLRHRADPDATHGLPLARHAQGLVRFERQILTRFNINNTPGLPENRIFFFIRGQPPNLVGRNRKPPVSAAVKNGVVQNFPDSNAVARSTALRGCWRRMSGSVSKDRAAFVWKDGEAHPHPTVFPAALFYCAAQFFIPGKMA